MSELWRRPVESSSIASIGYDEASRVLEVQFIESGEIYRYFDVPLQEYENFLAAPSKGTYLNSYLKQQGYWYERLLP